MYMYNIQYICVHVTEDEMMAIVIGREEHTDIYENWGAGGFRTKM